MSDEAPMLERLDDALRAVSRWILEESIPGVIVGGVAASLLGRPRLTRDVDAVILYDEAGWDRLLESAARYQLMPRSQDPRGFATRTRMLLLIHTPTNVTVDISLGGLSFEREMIERRLVLEVEGMKIPVTTPEDLLIMKALARRPNDLVDIETVLDANPEADLDRVRRWLREFASALDMPDIHEGFEQLLRRRK